MEIEKVLMGALAGATYGLTVYSKKENAEFNYKKFGTTVVLGAFAGIINSVMDTPMEAAYEFGISIGVVTIVENGAKAIYRKIIQPLIYKWNMR